MMETDKTYIELLTELKKKIRQARLRAAFSLNTEMLVLYWNVGHDIATKIKEAGWGAKVVNQLSKDLKSEFPEMNGFSPRNLRYMRSFAEAYPDFLQGDLAKSNETILQPSVAKLQPNYWRIALQNTERNGSQILTQRDRIAARRI